VALPEDLIDVSAVIDAYYSGTPDPENPAQQVVFGTSGHRGSSLDNAFNETTSWPRRRPSSNIAPAPASPGRCS
jgi:hypothetical protein